MRGGDEAAPTGATMILRTAKGSFSANTFAALAAHQDEFQGACPAIEIGEHTVDVDGAQSLDDMALLVSADLSPVFQVLSDEAGAAGDDAMCAIAMDAILTGGVRAVEACCAAICDAAAQS